jgi:hypothetical protein
MAMENELKFEDGVPSGKLKVPPKSCIPSKAKIWQNKVIKLFMGVIYEFA